MMVKHESLEGLNAYLREDHEQDNGEAAAVHDDAHVQPVDRRTVGRYFSGDERQVARPALPRDTESGDHDPSRWRTAEGEVAKICMNQRAKRHEA